jgi:tetratricopeptide (TPR) repeat protein
MYKIILSLLFLQSLSIETVAQTMSYAEIDSISYHQYLIGDWDGLLTTLRLAERNNSLYPNLLLRGGYAAMMKGNHSLSLKYYQNVLQLNSYNEAALYFAAYNNIQLSRFDAAVYYAKKLSIDNQNKLGLQTKKSVEFADAEISIKPNNATYRQTGTYFRARFNSRINHRLKLIYCFATYRQNFLEPMPPPPGPIRNPNPSVRTFAVGDVQGYLKSEYYINAKLSLTNALHIANTNFDNNQYRTAIFHAGIKYMMPSADVRLEINAGPLLDSLITQVAASSTYYPLGNLNFYGNSRLSYQKRTNLYQLNWYQMIGFKLHKKLWLEVHGTFGEIKNLIDHESLYIYDALDPGKYRIGGSILIPFNTKLTLNTNYFYEKKYLISQNTYYHLHSLTLGFTWKI